jgi:hypothetical protein
MDRSLSLLGGSSRPRHRLSTIAARNGVTVVRIVTSDPSAHVRAFTAFRTNHNACTTSNNVEPESQVPTCGAMRCASTGFATFSTSAIHNNVTTDTLTASAAFIRNPSPSEQPSQLSATWTLPQLLDVGCVYTTLFPVCFSPLVVSFHLSTIALHGHVAPTLSRLGLSLIPAFSLLLWTMVSVIIGWTQLVAKQNPGSASRI